METIQSLAQEIRTHREKQMHSQKIEQLAKYCTDDIMYNLREHYIKNNTNKPLRWNMKKAIENYDYYTPCLDNETCDKVMNMIIPQFQNSFTFINSPNESFSWEISVKDSSPRLPSVSPVTPSPRPSPVSPAATVPTTPNYDPGPRNKSSEFAGCRGFTTDTEKCGCTTVSYIVTEEAGGGMGTMDSRTTKHYLCSAHKRN